MLLAVVAIVLCAALAWFVPDMVVTSMANSTHQSVADLLDGKQVGEITLDSVHRVVAREPTSTTDLGSGRLEEKYIFNGLDRTSTMRVEYWQFEGDEQWYLYSVQMVSQRKL